MIRTVAVAALAMAAGTAVGFLLCRFLVPRLYRARRLQRDGGGQRKKVGVMDKVLILEAVTLVAYTVADLAVFWHTGGEPSTLTACVFGVCGLENGVMGSRLTRTRRRRPQNQTGAATGPPWCRPPSGRNPRTWACKGRQRTNDREPTAPESG